MKRCDHWMPRGKCVVRACPHWDGFRSGDKAARHRNQDPAIAARLAQPEEVLPEGKFRCCGCGQVRSVEEAFQGNASERGHLARCKGCEKSIRDCAGGSLADRMAG